MGWKIKWGQRSWTDADLTVGHMAVIVQAAGADDWEACNPLGGPLKLLGVLTALIAVDEARPWDAVLRELTAVNLLEFVNAINVLEEPDPVEDLPAAA